MTDLWTGEFGDAYTVRHRDRPNEFLAAVWRVMLPRHCESVLEIGANTGRNLQAIASFSQAELYACEPNYMARQELLANLGDVPRENIRPDFAHELGFQDDIVDLAFTMGVLIHVPADRLLPSMREIHRCARRWIICAEYFAPQEEMIPYRGTKDTLWRRDYGSIWMDNFKDLQCMNCTFLWKRLTGMDNLTVWVLEKGAKPN